MASYETHVITDDDNKLVHIIISIEKGEMITLKQLLDDMKCEFDSTLLNYKVGTLKFEYVDEIKF